MNYKRPEDQYKRNRAREMVEELKEVHQKALCTFSTVINYKKLDFSGHPHAGILTHVCSLDKGHVEQCKCVCGVVFKGWG